MRVRHILWATSGVVLVCVGSQLAHAQPIPALPTSDPLLPVAQPPVRFAPPAVDAAPAPMGGEAGGDESSPGKKCFRIGLEDGSTIVGEIADDAKLSLQSKVGKVAVELKAIGRVDRALQDNEFQVTLTNGDRLTGRITLDDLKLKAAWGEVPLSVKTLSVLESGKLFEQKAPVTRRSVDGRTMATVMQKHFRFQPSVADPNHPYPNSVLHLPQPRPASPDEWRPAFSTPRSAPPTLVPAPDGF